MSLASQLQRLSPPHEHCFFGYYDLPAWNRDGNKHLAHRVGFMDRMPKADDVAEVGFLAEGDPTFHRVGETTAWNFQQGAMLQWNPAAPNDQILYNQRKEGGFHGVIQDLNGKILQVLPRPIANVDPYGRFALSINFSRMMDYRPGYGYAGLPDPFAGKKQPHEDGIFRMDFDSGRCECILSLADLGELCRDYFGDRKVLINHLNLNPGGTRFVALFRHFRDKPDDRLRTIAITANADGSDPFILWDGGVASHYHWRDEKVLSMVIKDPEGHVTLAEFQDQTGEYRLVDPSFFLDDGHQSYSPNKQWLLYDSYPVKARRHLYLYDLIASRGEDLGSLQSQDLDNPILVEIRCDLHPRWHPQGGRISLDSMHEGYRGIYQWQLSRS